MRTALYALYVLGAILLLPFVVRLMMAVVELWLEAVADIWLWVRHTFWGEP